MQKAISPLSGKPLETADRILAAAVSLFAEKGYDGVSVKEIAGLASANSALISYYFGGKAQLYQAVLSRQADSFLAVMEKLKSKPLAPLQRLRLFIKEQARLQLSDPSGIFILYREFITPTQAGTDIVKNRFLGIYDRVRDELQAAQDTGSLKPDIDCQRAAFTLVSIFTFYILTRKYETVSPSIALAGVNGFSRLEGVCLEYLRTIAAAKEELP